MLRTKYCILKLNMYPRQPELEIKIISTEIYHLNLLQNTYY